jgi:hypothetical protein
MDIEDRMSKVNLTAGNNGDAILKLYCGREAV